MQRNLWNIISKGPSPIPFQFIPTQKPSHVGVVVAATNYVVLYSLKHTNEIYGLSVQSVSLFTQSVLFPLTTQRWDSVRSGHTTPPRSTATTDLYTAHETPHCSSDRLPSVSILKVVANSWTIDVDNQCRLKWINLIDKLIET